jgi:hypothetical protein
MLCRTPSSSTGQSMPQAEAKHYRLIVFSDAWTTKPMPPAHNSPQSGFPHADNSRGNRLGMLPSR